MKGHSFVRAHRAAALCELKQHECGLLYNLDQDISNLLQNCAQISLCFVVHSLCSYCMSFQFLFTLSLFNSLTVSLISFLIV